MFCRNTNSFQWELAWRSSSSLNFQSHSIFSHRDSPQVHRAFSSVQGPAALLHATKALANLVTNLLGPRVGMPGAQVTLGLQGKWLQAEMGHKEATEENPSAGRAAFFRQTLCLPSVMGCFHWLNLPEESITTSFSKTQGLRDLGPLHLTWHGKKLTGLYKNVFMSNMKLFLSKLQPMCRHVQKPYSTHLLPSHI